MKINKDWVEDHKLENGKYLNQCLSCRELFTGHKQRTHCKECNMNSPTLPNYIKPGAIVRIRHINHKYRIYATDGAGGTVHGAYFVHDAWALAAVDPREIISTWTDKPDCSALWPLLPPWIKYLAMSETGEWRGYLNKPVMRSAHWDGSGPNSYKWYIIIPTKYHPIFQGDWKDSLVERPQ